MIRDDKLHEFDPSTIVADIGGQLLTGEEETSGLNLFSELELNEECPVCLETMPLYPDQHIMCPICGNNTCSMCVNAISKTGSQKLCPVCGADHAKSQQKHDGIFKKGMLRLSERNNPNAAVQVGNHYRCGKDGFIYNPTLSLHYYLRAAKMGFHDGYANLGDAYGYGIRDILEKNMGMCIRFLEVAAKKGSVTAHKRLCNLFKNEISYSIAIDHASVLAKAGCSMSMAYLFEQLKEGHMTKDELRNILIAHKENMHLTLTILD